MHVPLAGDRTVREPKRLESHLRFDWFWTRLRHATREPGGRPTSPADHEWTGIEERYCDHHADCGAAQLAALLGTTARDVIDHMGALGVDVPPVPLLGESCPRCGRRMSVRGHGRENGVCDACHTELLLELRSCQRSERRARTAADLEAHRHMRGE